MRQRLLLGIAMAMMMTVLSACANKTVQKQPARPAAAAPAPKAAAAPSAVPAGQVSAEVYYPTGVAASSPLHVRKTAPSELQLGAQFNYTITVSNASNATLKNVVVTDQLGDGYKLASAQPPASSQDGNILIWDVGTLPSGEARTITVTGSATKVGRLVHCAMASYDLAACLAINVTNPQLELVKTTPAAVLKCEVIPVTLRVTNSGAGTAQNVRVTDTLPDGLITEDGKSSVTFDAGTLAQGQSREFTFNARATRTGSFANKAVATGANNLSAEASSNVKVTAPVLAVTKSGPAQRFAGRPIGYDLTVKNTGDGVARDTVLVDPLPAGATFISATEGGQLRGNQVVWELGDLAPGAQRGMQVNVTGTAIGEVRNVATARAFCAEAVSATAVTRIEGIPAILLEVVDIDDPVEVGSETVYEITVTNQGSKAGTNIVITVDLEEQMQFVDAGGATKHSMSGRTITFAPVASLAPKAQASWRVRIKALAEADVRLHVQMNSDQLGRDVRETEATNFYQ
jgi:uncharacterized repeat protein (TIGR01451 family)